MNAIEMTPKARRDRLFKRSRPHVRPLDWAVDGWVLWAAYDLDSFPNLPKGWRPDEFKTYVAAIASRHSAMLVVEDDCRHFAAGRGPCALINVDNHGWRIEPCFEYFRWTTERAKLRCAVAFLHMTKNSRDVGVCLVRGIDRDAHWLRRLSNYGVLKPCGFIPRGDPRGDEYLFSIGGRRGWVNGPRRERSAEGAVPRPAEDPADGGGVEPQATPEQTETVEAQAIETVA